jgi:hypothetical protein
MKALVSVRRFRRSTTLRLTTLLMLVLVATPFTAPFLTFDLGPLAGKSPIHVELVSAEKKAHDSATDLVSHTFTLLIVAVVIPPRPVAGRVELLESPQLVLRI